MIHYHYFPSPDHASVKVMNEDFDLDHSIEQAWRRFALRLEDVLSMMDDTEPLTLQPCDKAEHWYLRFSQEAKDQITAFVPMRTDTDHLTDDEIDSLMRLGWAESDDGFRIVESQDRCALLANAAVCVLREVFFVTHPVFLDSNVLAEILQEPAVREDPSAPLDEESRVYVGLDEFQLAAIVADELSAVFGAVPMRDQDGDFAVRVGSTMIFVRIPSDAKEIRLFSVLVHDIAGRSRAAEVLNDVNAHARWVKFCLIRDKIFVTMSILASPLVPSHFRQAIREMTNVADGVDDLLASSLEGKTTFPS